MARPFFVVPVELDIAARSRKGARALNPNARAEARCYFVCISKIRTDVVEELDCVSRSGLIERYAHRVVFDRGKGRAKRFGALSQEQRLIDALRDEGNWVINEPRPENRLVYVIQLEQSVAELPKALTQNPSRNPNLPCVYVGETGKSAEERFEEHKRGHRSSKWPERYGIRLAPELIPKEYRRKLDELGALRAEDSTARRLRQQGLTVFGGH